MQTQLYYYFDFFLISFYRLTGIAIVDYILGSALLSFFCVLIGQATYHFVYRINYQYLVASSKEMAKMHITSLRALKAKDTFSYKSCNHEANDAFGRYFFAQVATGMASIWPLPFALAWMQKRFGKVDFTLPIDLPGIGKTVGYLFTFLPIYIIVYWGVGKIKEIHIKKSEVRLD